MLERILIDEAVEMLFECAGDFARSPRTRPIHQACHAGVGKALHPFAEGRVGKVEGRRDSADVVASNDLPDGLRPAKDPSLLGLLQDSL